MTLQDIQDAISARFDYSGSTISSSTDEWTRRKRIINQAAAMVRQFLNGQWSFLLTTNTLTTTASQAYVTLPTDYERGKGIVEQSGIITINNLAYPLLNYAETLSLSTTDYYCYITGNKSAGYRLNINPTPSGAYSVPFPYYSSYLATNIGGMNLAELSSTTDVTKIPDPYFLVDWSIGELYRIDDESQGKWQPYKQEAQTKLMDMAAMDGREQNQSITIPLESEISGFDIYESDGGD